MCCRARAPGAPLRDPPENQVGVESREWRARGRAEAASSEHLDAPVPESVASPGLSTDYSQSSPFELTSVWTVFLPCANRKGPNKIQLLGSRRCLQTKRLQRDGLL